MSAIDAEAVIVTDLQVFERNHVILSQQFVGIDRNERLSVYGIGLGLCLFTIPRSDLFQILYQFGGRLVQLHIEIKIRFSTFQQVSCDT